MESRSNNKLAARGTGKTRATGNATAERDAEIEAIRYIIRQALFTAVMGGDAMTVARFREIANKAFDDVVMLIGDPMR